MVKSQSAGGRARPGSEATPAPAASAVNGASPAAPATSHCRLVLPTPCGVPAPCNSPCDLHLGPERHALLELGNLARLAVMALPGRRGSFLQQATELFAQLSCILRHQTNPLQPTTMMVFLRDGADEAEAREIVHDWFGASMPVTTFVVQPPCGGAALGVELWALGGPGVTVKRLGPQLLTAETGGIRWIYAGDVRNDAGVEDAYTQSRSAFEQMRHQLARAGAGLHQVLRTWLYIRDITEGGKAIQRYQEFNRARADVYGNLQFGTRLRAPGAPETFYPASTGIGTGGGAGVTMACLAMESGRPDVFVLPLENPLQTPAFDYEARHSPQSPRFSRAMAVVQGHFVSTLVSGTASIVDSRTAHAGDIVRQTEQTLGNIERLIAPENFARHGLPGAGATLRDVAKLRVYVKRAADYESCRAVVERHLPRVPAIYLQADVCRPDLLVEIEAVAFSPLGERGTHSRNGTLASDLV